jgi:hypothetical protein
MPRLSRCQRWGLLRLLALLPMGRCVVATITAITTTIITTVVTITAIITITDIITTGTVAGSAMVTCTGTVIMRIATGIGTSDATGIDDGRRPGWSVRALPCISQ